MLGRKLSVEEGRGRGFSVHHGTGALRVFCLNVADPVVEIATGEPRGDAASRAIAAVIDVGHSARMAAAAWFQ